ncbi:MAG: phosphate/phosphite/phosphonate ABC transporter substrate-binding protein [Candidatus Kapabacteria bacterium]|nr:phosphate/phosphite/phosphonate ABC transporter substrate-binding protein [Candidatus Kapabacteria bacterium]
MLKQAFIYSIIFVAIVFKLSIFPMFNSGDTALGSKAHPIKIMLTPSVEANKVTTSADALVEYLHQKTGLFYTASVPSSFMVVVESFGSGAADIALTNTFSYVLAHEKYGAEAAMMVLRRHGEKTYRGQIITRSDNGIASLNDLQGKSFAYVDAASTSGYILPKALLEQRKITPSQIVFGNKHDIVVTMVYQKQVDAGATYYSAPDTATKEYLDARVRVKRQFPDVFEKVKILELTEEIPNDPLVFRKNFPTDIRNLIIKSLIEFQQTPKGKTVLFDTYSIEGLIPTHDSNYETLRTMIRKYGGDVQAVLARKK